MMPYNKSELDSSIAKAMIHTAIDCHTIKFALQKIATELNKGIFQDLKKEIIHSVDVLKIKYSGLAMQHSQGDQVFGALLSHYSQEYLLTPNGQKLLLETLEARLQNPVLDTEQDFLSLIKVFDGIGYAYDRMQAGNISQFHQTCKNLIMPTLDEEKMRVLRENRQSPSQKFVATTYGIGTKIGVDLKAEQETPNGYYSGKARFFMAPIHEREANFRIKTSLDGMASSLPLIAGVSSSTARFFIMAHCIDLFKKADGLFDLDQAQIIANCLMAYFVYCGHHSFLEVIEVWNRQIDFLAMNRSEQLEKGIISDQPSAVAVELKLPYAEIGNYSSFLHPSYAASVMLLMYQQLERGLDYSFTP